MLQYMNRQSVFTALGDLGPTGGIRQTSTTRMSLYLTCARRPCRSVTSVKSRGWRSLHLTRRQEQTRASIPQMRYQM